MTMTTHGPLSRFSVIRESIAVRLRQRPCRKISAVAASDVVADVTQPSHDDSENVGFCGEPFADKGELLASLSPLLFSMKLVGLYFSRKDQHQHRTGDPEWNQRATKNPTPSNRLRVYATVFLVLLWLNFLRFASVFNQGDHFGALLFIKIAVFNWFGLTTIFQTSYYFASHTGKLDKVLLKLPVSHDCVVCVHRAVVGITALFWINLAADLSLGTYLFFNGDGEQDIILTPFVTHIEVPEDDILIARVLWWIGYMPIFPGVFLSHAMNSMLVYIFYTQFKKLKKNFRLALGEEGQFNGDVSIFRRRHQTLSSAVSKVDGFIKFGNVAGFVCHIVNIILLIYSLIFFPESRKDFITGVTTVFWLSTNINGLLFSAVAGITVNHMVRT